MLTVKYLQELYPRMDAKIAVCLAFMDGLIDQDELDELFDLAEME